MELREIKFRGMRKAKNMVGVWTVGNYHKGAFTGCSFINGYEVIPETVGQFTGLPDKNEKEIYEGDVLNCGDRVVYVYWNIYCGTWDSKFIRYTKKPLSSNGITPNEWKYRAEVIGNIHDNPELLEVIK